jgi:hypothetical protein
MLRSNPSALPDVRAWAATLLSLLIFLAPHARTSNAINLLDTHSISPFTEIPWLPFGKIYGAEPWPCSDWPEPPFGVPGDPL